MRCRITESGCRLTHEASLYPIHSQKLHHALYAKKTVADNSHSITWVYELYTLRP